MDAMYLAGMVADGSKLTRAQPNKWAKSAVGLQMLSEYTVPMSSKDPSIAAGGWSPTPDFCQLNRMKCGT